MLFSLFAATFLFFLPASALPQFSDNTQTVDISPNVPVGVDPDFRVRVAFMQTPIKNVSAAAVALELSTILGVGSLRDRLTEKPFGVPWQPDVIIWILPGEAKSIEAKYVIWGLYYAICQMIDVNGDDFVEAAAEIAIGSRTKGYIYFQKHGARPSGKPPSLSVPAASLPVTNTSSTFNSTGDSDINTISLPSHPSTWIGQPRMFQGMLNAVIALSSVTTFVPGRWMRIPLENAQIVIRVGPPNGVPRPGPPVMNRFRAIESLQQVAR